jgi:hypothetical protein
MTRFCSYCETEIELDPEYAVQCHVCLKWYWPEDDDANTSL